MHTVNTLLPRRTSGALPHKAVTLALPLVALPDRGRGPLDRISDHTSPTARLVDHRGPRHPPGGHRLSLPSLSWQAGTVALWHCDGQNRRDVTLRRPGEAHDEKPQARSTSALHRSIPGGGPKSRSRQSAGQAETASASES